MGKYNSFRSKRELIILFFPLFLSFCVSAATAQVIIKEKIEIDGLAQNKVNNKSFGLNADSIESYLVMPKRGMLVASIWGIQHLDVPLPGYSTFNVHFIKGDSTKTDSLIKSIPLSFDSLYGWLNFCGPPPVLNRMWYSYFSDPAYEFYLGGVNEGDTVQFIYHSDDVNNGEPIDYGYLSAEPRGSGNWYMKIGSYDDCIWDYDNAVFLYINTLPWDSLYVSITPGNLYPGDTANVVIKKRLFDGTLADFDTSQTFEIAKLEGCIWGNILVGDSLSSYFYGAHQPIKFVVDTAIAVIDSLAADTGRVIISVGAINAGQKEITSAQTPNNITDCFTGSLVIPNPILGDASIYSSLEIISPTAEDTYWINEVPAMPQITCQAKLNNYVLGNVTFEWEFWVRYNLNRHAFYYAHDLCERTGMVLFRETTTTENSNETYWNVEFSLAKLDSSRFKAMRPTIDERPRYGGDCNETRTWTEGENIFTGGYLWIKLIAKDNVGKIIAKTQQDCGLILGRNPDPQSVIDYANPVDYKAIVYHESLIAGMTFQQFNSEDNNLYYKSPPAWGGWLIGSLYNKKGFPTYGPPNGFGLAKIDTSPTELDLWNWKHNVDSGRKRFDVAKSLSTRWMEDAIKKGATYNEQVFYENAYQNYNGGRFWDWDEYMKEWILNKQKRVDNLYGKILYQDYLSLRNQFSLGKDKK